jgi:hypothetical protein
MPEYREKGLSGIVILTVSQLVQSSIRANPVPLVTD